MSEFAVDLRGRFEEVNIFEVGIAPSERLKDSLRVRFDGAGNLRSVYLFWADRGRIRQVGPETEMTVAGADKTQYRTLFVTSEPDRMSQLPVEFSFGVPFPNPCHPVMKVRYTLPYRWRENGELVREPYEVRMLVYDLRGRVVREVVRGRQEPGHHLAVWDGRSGSGVMTSSGAYLVGLKAANFTAVKRITVLK